VLWGLTVVGKLKSLACKKKFVSDCTFLKETHWDTKSSISLTDRVSRRMFVKLVNVREGIFDVKFVLGLDRTRRNGIRVELI